MYWINTITERKKKTRYRSNLEVEFANDLQNKGLTFEYEGCRIPYVPKLRHYTPDFYIAKFDFYVETKGLFTIGDRTKHLLIKEQYPDLDIRFIFSRPTNKLDKRTKTTYGDWCDRYGFLYSKDRIPREWMMTSKKKKKISKIL